MPAPKKYPEEMKDRAIRLVEDLLADPEIEIQFEIELDVDRLRFGVVSRPVIRSLLAGAEQTAQQGFVAVGVHSSGCRDGDSGERDQRDGRRLRCVHCSSSVV